MARHTAADGARSGRATPIVLLLLVAIAAMGFYSIVPDCFRARDGIRVELAARAARRCDAAARDYVSRGWRDSVTNVTPEMVDAYYARLHEPAIAWPAAADLSTLDFSDTNGVSVVVSLRGGPRRVSAADLVRPDTPPQPSQP